MSCNPVPFPLAKAPPIYSRIDDFIHRPPFSSDTSTHITLKVSRVASLFSPHKQPHKATPPPRGLVTVSPGIRCAQGNRDKVPSHSDLTPRFADEGVQALCTLSCPLPAVSSRNNFPSSFVAGCCPPQGHTVLCLSLGGFKSSVSVFSPVRRRGFILSLLISIEPLSVFTAPLSDQASRSRETPAKNCRKLLRLEDRVLPGHCSRKVQGSCDEDRALPDIC